MRAPTPKRDRCGTRREACGPVERRIMTLRADAEGPRNPGLSFLPK
jgi:hypothetical protein